jgi:hypothetical protein
MVTLTSEKYGVPSLSFGKAQNIRVWRQSHALLLKKVIRLCPIEVAILGISLIPHIFHVRSPMMSRFNLAVSRDVFNPKSEQAGVCAIFILSR